MNQQRQLAAIMFTDIEGYSAMMQQHESVALAVRDRHRSILQNGHEQYHGHVVQYYGDGTLSIFRSAVEAVQCAAYMQHAYCRQAKIPVRIGLHIGDIISDGENIFGDGVNLAARVESLGIPGAVLKTVSVGTYLLKNITRPVEVFALDQPGLVQPEPRTLTGKTAEVADRKARPAAITRPPLPSAGAAAASCRWPQLVAVLPFRVTD